MTHKIILISIMLLLSVVTYSQESFKKSLEAISTDLCTKMSEKGKKKVVVLFVTDINKAQTTAGKYMADVVSYYIVNNQNGFSVFDRENLSGIAEAKKLIAEGYIDANNAKQLGKILSVEAIVVGNYTVLSSSLSLTLKALDVNDGFVIAQSLKDLPIDKDAAALLGISPLDGSQSNLSNKGFDNRPLNSNESYNNPETVNKECQTKNTGDYCFQNLTNLNIRVRIDIPKVGLMFLTLKPGQTQCFYNINSGAVEYCLMNADIWGSSCFSDGQILIEKCKSKTFVIK
jgi:hypothetical protein